ncbi:SCO4848 family membrane protein [Amycolatopsis methanolica]|uniref:SCO4848 family membrane protein n=1 Tax=Amycolatopsis methanolica TaxID=1814 RepID=UPI000476A949|nr:membrane protein [Amycolatopsis methanolica]
MSRRVAWFLLAFGIWSWVIWITFVKNLWASENSWGPDGSATGFFVVHLILAIVSFTLGTIIGIIGWRGLRTKRPDKVDV